MTNVSPRTTTRSVMAETVTPPATKTVQVSLMDTYALSIPKIKPDEVKLRFPNHQLTKIEGDPEYKQMLVIREEIYRNVLSIKSIFGGGKQGHKGSLTKQKIYWINMGEEWVVPAKVGVYLIFRANATKNSKKQTIAEFISRETNIKMSKVVEEQLTKPNP